MDQRCMALEIEPEWENIKALWDPCMEALTERGFQHDEAYALSMVAQELLENAVKYGSFGRDRNRIRFDVRAHGDTLTIEVRSPLGDDHTSLKRLDAMVQWIRGYQNPFEAYVERLKEVATRPHQSGESGLGLVRVAYEGQCILDFFIDQSNVLAMSAVYRGAQAREVRP